MMPSAEIETNVAAGKKAVADALAALPFRATPSWEDLDAVIGALLRFIVSGPPASPAAGEPAMTAPADDTFTPTTT